MRFEGKVAVVTGGARGIGKAIVEGFAREGATVVIADILDDQSRETADAIISKGGKAIPIEADVTNSKMVESTVDQVLSSYGKIDILVNNVGWDQPEPFIQNSEEKWDKIIAINYKGTVIFSRAVLDNMMQQKYGRIVNIVSDAGLVGSHVGEAVYSGCKGGVIAFGKALAREMALYNITVNAVSPGPTESPLFNKAMQENPKLLERLTRISPMRRIGRPEEITAATLFFASDDAGYITGQVLSVSGGLRCTRG